MLIEYLGWPLSVLVLLIYGLCCVMTILFTFFPEQYRRTEEILSLSFFPNTAVNPLDINVNLVDSWAKQHNKGVGVVLSVFSVFNFISVIRILIV
jgi:hypothetical protein